MKNLYTLGALLCAASLSVSVQAKDLEVKIAIYDQLRSTYPPQEFGWSSSGMWSLFDLYANSQPRKALELAHKMNQGLDPETSNAYAVKTWGELQTYQQNLVNAIEMNATGDYAAALGLLDETTLPRGINGELYYITRADSLMGATGREGSSHGSRVTVHRGQQAGLRPLGAYLH